MHTDVLCRAKLSKHTVRVVVSNTHRRIFYFILTFKPHELCTSHSFYAILSEMVFSKHAYRKVYCLRMGAERQRNFADTKHRNSVINIYIEQIYRKALKWCISIRAHIHTHSEMTTVHISIAQQNNILFSFSSDWILKWKRHSFYYFSFIREKKRLVHFLHSPRYRVMRSHW